MGCPSCGAENPAAAKFCEECGEQLPRYCPWCRREVGATAKFCLECGERLVGAPRSTATPPELSSPQAYTPRHLAEKILASRAGLEGERKQVTVLFADVVGSTELVRDRDPEDAQRLLDGVVARLMEAVHCYEGTVSRLMGDGLMALFGAPVAHEDHAVRACYAALAMVEGVRDYADEARRAHGAAIQVRVGINSGEVVVRLISDDLHMDYTALGQTVHLASRMEGLAAGGTVLLTRDTLMLAEGYVEVRALGPREVKGLARPVEAYELVGAGTVRNRLQASAARGLVRFVGRDAEMTALLTALERAGTGHGQVVALVGEPGVGKSRLIHEVSANASTAGWLVLRAEAVSYEKATPYLPVVDVLRRHFGIEARDDARAIREKVTARLLAVDEAMRPALAPLLALLDAPTDDPAWAVLDPTQRRRRTLDAVERLLLRESRERPLLLVVEDLHWVDPETQALLDGLVEALPAARVLLLLSHRPEYTHAWDDRSGFARLRIDPLGRRGAAELLDGLLGDDPTLRPLHSLLIERAGGNPLFLEESVRALVEEDVLCGRRGVYRLVGEMGTIRVPPTVRAILASRIDRLPPGHKRLLQTAAVVGRDVPLGLLRAVAGLGEDEVRRGVQRLRDAELLDESSLFPEPEYVFRHALTHEVAYEGLLQARRRELHAAIVDAIEARVADPSSQAETLARHALGGEVWSKAVPYLRQAGATAMARSAYPAAAGCYEQALATLRRLDPSHERLAQEIDLHFDLRNALMPLGEPARILAYLREAETLARTVDDPRRLGWLSVYMNHALWQLGRPAEARPFGQRGLGIADELQELPLRVAAQYFVGHACYASGDYRGAEDALGGLVRLLPGSLGRERFGLLEFPAVLGRAFLACALAERGALDDATVRGQQAVRLAESIEQPYSLIYACWGLAQVAGLRGDVDDAVRLLERSVALCRDWKISLQLAVMTGFLGAAHARAGRVEQGLGLLHQALTSIESMGWRTFYSRLVAHFGEAFLLVNRPAEALIHAERAVSLARQGGQRGFEAYALRLLAEVAARREPPDGQQAEARYYESLTLAEELGMRPLQAHCHLGLGKIYRRIGRRDEAHAELATAVSMLREMGMAFWLPEAERELAEATR